MRRLSFYNKIYILLLFAVLLISFGTFTLLGVSADAPSSSLVIPLSPKESYPLSKPVSVFMDDEISAVIQEDNSLVVYNDGAFKVLTANDKGFLALKQVTRFSNDQLILSNNGSIYTVSLNDYTVSLLTYGSDHVGGSCFDFNGKHLVTSYGGNAFVYEITNGAVSSVSKMPGSVTDTTIAVNSTNAYYVKDNKIFTRTFADFNNEIELYSVSPSKIIANDECLYYLFDGNIYRLSLDGESCQKLSFPESVYDLGKIISATDISFHGANLLICDKLGDSVQEFSVNAGTLTFTGVAIAKGKTAFNRIGKDSTAIEKFGNRVAVLDPFKLTVINTDDVGYSNGTFTNLYINDAPDAFALGNQTILSVKDNALSSYDLKTNASNQLNLQINGEILDVCYKCSYYYVLTQSVPRSSNVYKIDEKTFEIVDEKHYTNKMFEIFEVDVMGKIYFASDSSLYIDRGDGQASIFMEERWGVKKMITDLAGNLYVDNGSGLYLLIDNIHEIWQDLKLKAKDFALSIDNEEVYYLKTDSSASIHPAEHLYKTSELGNVAISSIEIPNDFSLDGENASLDQLKLFSTTQGSNTFSVSIKDQNFNYVDVKNTSEDYIFIKEIAVTNNFNVLVLKNQEGLAIANKVNANTVNLEVEDAPDTSFITTPVHAYFLPLITMEMEHSLVNGSEKVLLQKYAGIRPLNKITLFDVDFYYAEVLVDGQTRTAFVPSNFTVEILSVDKIFPSFTYEEITATEVFTDQELTTKITDLPSSKVKVYQTQNNFARIQYLDNGVWKEGYISNSAILDKPGTSVRNVLIILLVFTTVCGSTVFFILKRKK